jgi:hypothetical protein
MMNWNVKAATTATTLSQAITAGTLNISIVDNNGDVVGSPSVGFSSKSFLFVAQNSTGTLGISSEKIRLDNPTSTATWSVTIAATGGESAVWSDGGTNTYPYNAAAADDGRLTVNPSTGTITPFGTCTNTNVALGTSDYFVSGGTASIDLMTASAGADTFCRWDLTGVSLTQRIPASQPAASYTLGMTITAL